MRTPAHEYIELAMEISRANRLEGLSERKLAARYNLSKSEIHRLLIISKLPGEIRQAAVVHDIQKYVLIDWHNMKPTFNKTRIAHLIIKGSILNRKDLRRYLEKYQ